MYPYPENRELLIEGIRAPNAQSAKNRNLHSTRPIGIPSARLQRSQDMVQLQLMSGTEVPDFLYQQAPLRVYSPQFSTVNISSFAVTHSAPFSLLEANKVGQRMSWCKAARRTGGCLFQMTPDSVSQSLSHCGVPAD